MDAIQDIFKNNYSQVKRSMPLNQIKAANNIINCRTSAMGGRVHQCPSGEDGHDHYILYNSCHYRYCPQCNLLPRLKSLEQYQQRLLNCAHRQVVFTVPHELNKLWLHNTRVMADLLFRSVSATLKTFLEDKKWLGAKAGYSLVMHTWGRNLSLHPHIHAVITEGGLDNTDTWIEPRYDCFLPAEAMMRKFRGAYISGIRKLLRDGRLSLPPGQTATALREILNKVYTQKKWNVRVEGSYSHGEGIIKYLSRYLKGGPIRSHQVKQRDDGVVLRYKDHRTGTLKWQHFEADKFVSQLLIHTPPDKMPMIRHYGLYAAGCKEPREKARAQLAKLTIHFDIEAFLESLGIDRSETCSMCGQTLLVAEISKKKRLH